MLKIGLIGAGWHAVNDHVPALRHCADDEEFRGRVELTGVCDIDAAKAADAAARFGFRRAYHSVETMLGDVDAVLAIVPPAAMLTTLEAIVQRSRPALIEKPLGRDLDEARTIAAMLDGHPHMVSLNRRFDPGVQIARQWLAKQSPPRNLLAIMSRRDRTEPDFAWGTGIHMTDLLCFLLGPLKLARGRRDGINRLGIFERSCGVEGSVDIRPASGRVEESVRIVGDDWDCVVETGTHAPWQVLCVGDNAVEVNVEADPATPDFIRNGTADETVAFLRGLLNGRMTGPTVADAMPGTELAAALQALDESTAYHGNPR